MKYFLVILILFSFPAFAQQQSPPEARPFAKGITSFEQYEAEKTGKDKKKGPDAKTPDGRQPYVEIWLPPEFQSTEQKWPLIVFSHGFGGCANESRFLTRFLADNGYIVLAPHHTDENCSSSRFGDSGFGSRMTTMRAGQKRDWPERSFRNPDIWTDKTEVDRKDDVVFALESMFDDRQYRNYIDLGRIGVMGRGLGGYTALGLTGGWPAWRDRRFRAAFVLSPYVGPFLLQQRIKSVGVPVMYLGGTRESDATPILAKRGGAYDQTPAPKYYLELRDAEESAWTDADRDYHVIVQNAALAFFDRYLKKQPVKMTYEPGKGQVADFREDQGGKK